MNQSYSTQQEIEQFISSMPISVRSDLMELNQLMQEITPYGERWFFDGKNPDGKMISNPSIGYGSFEIIYANGNRKPFYRIGISPNKTGISIYMMTFRDKTYLKEKYAKIIGKAKISNYCIKFRRLADLQLSVLKQIIDEGLN